VSDYRNAVRTSFRTTVLTGVLAVFVVGVTLTVVFERNIQELLIAQSEDLLEESSRLPTFFSEFSRILGRQIYLDAEVQAALGYATTGPRSNVDVLRALRSIYRGLSYLDSLYLYTPESDQVFMISEENGDAVYSLRSLPDASFERVVRDYREYTNYQPVLRLESITANPEVEDFTYTFLLYNYIPVDDIEFVIAMNYSPQILMTAQNETEVYAVDTTGAVQIPSTRYRPLQSLAMEEHIRTILESNGEGNSFVYQREPGERYLVSYRYSSSVGWYFVSEQSYRQIMQLPRSLRLFLLGLVAAGSVALAVMTAIQRSRVLSASKRQDAVLKSLRQQAGYLAVLARKRVLTDLLTGRYHVTGEQIMQTLEEMSQAPENDAAVALLVVKAYRAESMNSSRWQNLVADIERLLPNTVGVVESVEHRDDIVILVLRVPAHENPDGVLGEPSRLAPLKRAFDCGFGITSTVQEISELGLLSAEVDSILHLLFFDTAATLVCPPFSVKGVAYDYPEEDERRLIEMVLQAKSREAKDILRSIIRSTADHDHGVLKMVTFRLVFELRRALRAIEATDHAVEAQDLSLQPLNSESALDSLPNIDVMLNLFYRAIDEVTAIIRDSRDGHREKLVEEVNRIVTDRCFDAAFHLGEVADLMGLHPHYLSRVYKQETGISIPRRILTLRIDAAKRRLLSSPDPVRAVLTSVGLPDNAHVFRVFKQHTGMTPNQYRHANTD
jgi:AraC-like DNA-binding protein